MITHPRTQLAGAAREHGQGDAFGVEQPPVDLDNQRRRAHSSSLPRRTRRATPGSTPLLVWA